MVVGDVKFTASAYTSDVTIEDVVNFVQGQFTDGLALVVGSGLSAAEGMPGMPALAMHLSSEAESLVGSDRTLWAQIQTVLDAGAGLEAALLRHPPSPSLEGWIVKKTCGLLLIKEREIMGEAIRGTRTLRLTLFLRKVLKPATGFPIITTNYDRLIEVAAEFAGLHVDTTAIGQYAGSFDHTRSCMGSCRGITTRAKTNVLDHFPRAVVLKPHGSFDWYKAGDGARRCSLDIDGERLIITPGLNKYRAGYNAPFDKHRELANDWINKSAKLLVVGYGFNDDHLQTHLIKRIKDGTPTLILNRTATDAVKKLAEESPACVCLSAATAGNGVSVVTKGSRFEDLRRDLWDVGILAEELL